MARARDRLKAVILKDRERQTYMIVCERLRDQSRFVEYTTTPREAVRLLRNTSPKHYRPLYIVRLKA